MTPIVTATIVVGAWSVLSGILHDIAVLRSEHGKQYDRNLLRLLMDGHILITCGIVQLIGAWAMHSNLLLATAVAAIACLSLIVYCAMIFPFLKSYATLIMNSLLLIALITQYALA